MDYQNAFPFYTQYQRDKQKQPLTPQNIKLSTVNSGGFWNQRLMLQNPAINIFTAQNEDKMQEDMEYLQQMYPNYAKKYQPIIKSALDKVDYKGSFIYDQYPDKLQLMRIIDSIVIIIRDDEAAYSKPGDNQDGQTTPPIGEGAMWQDKEIWIRELVTVLMYNEILMRRKKSF